MVAVSVISILGIGSGTMFTAHAVTTLEICSVELTNTDEGVELTWNTNEGADSYEIYRKTEGGDYRKVAIADSTETTWVDESVTTDTTYTYYVQPVSEDETWDYEEATISHKSATSTATSTTATSTVNSRSILPLFHLIFVASTTIMFAVAGIGLLYVCATSNSDSFEDHINRIFSLFFLVIAAVSLIDFLFTLIEFLLT